MPSVLKLPNANDVKRLVELGTLRPAAALDIAWWCIFKKKRAKYFQARVDQGMSPRIAYNDAKTFKISEIKRLLEIFEKDK